MRLRMREFRPQMGPVGYRVVQPSKQLRHTALSDPAGYGRLVGDHDGLSRLAGLCSFAAYSRRTIVHVPLRNGVAIDGEELNIRYSGGRVDLALIHHSLDLRITKWPELRRKLVNGRPLTVRTDERRTARDSDAWWERRPHAGMRDWLRPVTYARTLFLIGSRDAFAAAAVEFEGAAGWGPRQKNLRKGFPALMTTLTWILEPDPSPHRPEIDISFMAYPPYAHFRRPNEPAARRTR